MLKFYTQIFKKLGKQTKIFQDHTPQLSSIFASSVCALPQLSGDIIKSTIVPMRSDNYAIDGAEKIIIEMEELQETFNMLQSIDVHCYFSSIDRRISTTSQAIMVSQSKKRIIENLSPVVVRYCAEIPKSIQSAQNIYSSGKTNKATEDYQELLQTIFSKSEGV
jgi:cellulose biosynthesis protein BcsQ